MIAPAVLISASGTLVLSTSNRLTRVVDRVRASAGRSPGSGFLRPGELQASGSSPVSSASLLT
ncbi:MAG TPA: DUF2721 domain-containing protein [Thermoanaerobaculia bacterium]|nr:DUF2721 domain-containing protein [Thermoanaerobaculia bacterium]